MLLDTLQGWRLRNPRRLPGTNRQARHLPSASKEKKRATNIRYRRVRVPSGCLSDIMRTRRYEQAIT